jgi:MFS family permease
LKIRNLTQSASFGALGTGYFSNRWGRKPCMIAAGLIYIIGSVIQAVVGLGTNRANALSVLYFARCVKSKNPSL